jgi:hypothetical protein
MTLVGNGTTFNISAGALAVGSDALTAIYTPDALSSVIYFGASNTVTITVAAPPQPAYALTAANVTLAAGAATGDTSTVTVTPSGGFTGSIALSAAVTTSPAGATLLPALSFGSTSPVNITGTNAGTATLTIFTTAASSPGCTNTSSRPQRASAYTFAGTALACLLFFGIPARRRRWRSLLGIFLLLAAFTATMTACGGGGHGGVACPQVITPGTTAGNYTITVTGTSGSQSQTTTLTLTVQ